MIAVAKPGDDWFDEFMKLGLDADEHRKLIVQQIDQLAAQNKKERAPRPAHRPPAPVSTGRDVALLVESNVSLDRAKAIIAEKRGLKPSTVDRAYRLYRQKKRGDK